MAGVAVFNLKHVAINETLTMPLIIISYETEVKPTWASTQVYGRMDPIFSYQNTVRTFKAVLRTPRKLEKFTKSQYEVFLKGGKKSTAFSPSGEKHEWIAGPMNYLRDIADLYKMMYPVYRNPSGRYSAGLSKSTGDMIASPLMALDLSGIAYDGLKGAGATNLGNGMLFVPQNFTVTSLVDTGKPSITVTSAADLRFFANAEGYTITLGGTILHKSGAVGFLFDRQGNIAFGQGKNFPYNTNDKSAFFEPDRIMANLEADQLKASELADEARQRENEAAERCSAAAAALAAAIEDIPVEGLKVSSDVDDEEPLFDPEPGDTPQSEYDARVTAAKEAMDDACGTIE